MEALAAILLCARRVWVTKSWVMVDGDFPGDFSDVMRSAAQAIRTCTGFPVHLSCGGFLCQPCDVVHVSLWLKSQASQALVSTVLAHSNAKVLSVDETGASSNGRACAAWAHAGVLVGTCSRPASHTAAYVRIHLPLFPDAAPLLALHGGSRRLAARAILQTKSCAHNAIDAPLYISLEKRLTLYDFCSSS